MLIRRSRKPQRLVLLEAKNATGDGCFKLLLPDTIVNKVGLYKRKLSAALTRARVDDRIAIRDEVERHEDILCRVLECLGTGHVPGFEPQERATYITTLRLLFDMLLLFERLRTYNVFNKIEEMMESVRQLDLEQLLEFAAYVYGGNPYSLSVHRSSWDGNMVKRKLKASLPKLRKDQRESLMTRAREPLRRQLLEVMLERLDEKGWDSEQD